jgi:hypothetical protein
MARSLSPRDVTIYDVARRAGVSISTVSLALNSGTRVSTQTRAKVLAAADELGFEPKEHAVARARQGVGRIGVIGSDRAIKRVCFTCRESVCPKSCQKEERAIVVDVESAPCPDAFKTIGQRSL